MMEMFYIFIMVVVTHVYTFLKKSIQQYTLNGCIYYM